MYISIDDQTEVDAMVEILKTRSQECVAFKLGVCTNVVFFHNLEADGGYLLMTHDMYNNVHRYAIDITDERSMMKAVIERESWGSREIEDSKLDEILTLLEQFKPRLI